MAEADMDSTMEFKRRATKDWLWSVVAIISGVGAFALGVHWVAVLAFTAVAIAAIMLRETPDEHSATRRTAPPAVDIGEAAVLSTLAVLDFPIYLLDERGDIVFANKSALTAFGPLPESRHLSLRLRSPAILDMVRETISTGMTNTAEYSERLPSTRVYAVRISAVDWPQGLVRRFVITFRDLSDVRRIDRMRSDFVANASHELRTPLAALGGFIETLQGPARRDQQAADRFLGIMMEQVTRMNRLVDDLLSLSRLELKAHIAPSEQVELAPLLGHVRDSLSHLAADLGVELALKVPDAPVYVLGDRDELIQVFENLVQNACKYGQEGKKVEINLSTGEGGSPVEVTVRDYGQGIPAEHIPRLTERFYRVSVEASRSKKGTGLGLAIVKHILTRHRARLIIKSEVGEGSSFTVRF